MSDSMSNGDSKVSLKENTCFCFFLFQHCIRIWHIYFWYNYILFAVKQTFWWIEKEKNNN